jgi:hypothetical protein
MSENREERRGLTDTDRRPCVCCTFSTFCSLTVRTNVRMPRHLFIFHGAYFFVNRNHADRCVSKNQPVHNSRIVHSLH